MARTPFQVEVLTPEGVVFNDEVEMVSTKTTVGSIGLLANHQPLLAMLDPTELRLYKSESDVVRSAQGEGFLQVRSPGEGSTLVFNDVVFNLRRLPGLFGFVYHLLGSSGAPKVTRLLKLFLVKDKRALRAHLERRFESYGTILSPRESESAMTSIRKSRAYLLGALRTLLAAAIREGADQGMRVPEEGLAETDKVRATPRQKLPRNTDQEDLDDDERKVAEVAAKFLQVCGMFDDLAVRRMVDEEERETYLRSVCSEEQARVYEATVHNLQSTYDTQIQNTVLEARDDVLVRGVEAPFPQSDRRRLQVSDGRSATAPAPRRFERPAAPCGACLPGCTCA